jgi:hypothetical protein
MKACETLLLAGGLIFPTLSLLTLIASAATRWRSGRYASPVFVPLVGPMLLSIGVLVGGHSAWFIPLVWLTDVGTLAFLVVLPELTRQGWETSRFTRRLSLRGEHDLQRAVITLHRGGRYRLKKSWNRPRGETGIVELGELGMFSETAGGFILVSDHGLSREFSLVVDGAYLVREELHDRPELQNYSLDGWRLEASVK